MFADAIEKASKYTRPMMAVYHCVDGKCRTGVGSFVVVNDHGWIITAWHLNKMLNDLSGAVVATKAHLAQIAAIENNKALQKGPRKVALKQTGTPRGDAPLDFAVWWSWDSVKLVDISLLQDGDLMIGRLDPFDPTWVGTYPVFKDPATPIRQGTSLCRFGYPFPTIKATYAPPGGFTITDMGITSFPNEGILTRTVEVSQNPAGYRNRLIETSSPGLKGQSGGPILDTAGRVWGIQSRTAHLSLGFDPEVMDEDGKSTKRKEHQFLNVGWASHPETVVGFLHEKGLHTHLRRRERHPREEGVMKESGKVIGKETSTAKTQTLNRVESGSSVRSDEKARFVTGAWSTKVDVATTTMPSKPTFSRDTPSSSAVRSGRK